MYKNKWHPPQTFPYNNINILPIPVSFSCSLTSWIRGFPVKGTNTQIWMSFIGYLYISPNTRDTGKGYFTPEQFGYAAYLDKQPPEDGANTSDNTSKQDMLCKTKTCSGDDVWNTEEELLTWLMQMSLCPVTRDSLRTFPGGQRLVSCFTENLKKFPQTRYATRLTD